MLKVGITGGIGSGKTTVCKIFETLDVPVYYSDDRAKWLMSNDPLLKKNIINSFGTESYVNNDLNRKYIADIVFKDKSQLELLNSIVHPAVRQDANSWVDHNNSSPYTLQEAALLFENNAYKALDYMITVIAPVELRISRVTKRDDSKKIEVQRRIDNQFTDDQRLSLTDFTINNDGYELLIPQILSLHKKLIELSTFPNII